jgi:hypothetical protein
VLGLPIAGFVVICVELRGDAGCGGFRYATPQWQCWLV